MDLDWMKELKNVLQTSGDLLDELDETAKQDQDIYWCCYVSLCEGLNDLLSRGIRHQHNLKMEKMANAIKERKSEIKES